MCPVEGQVTFKTMRASSSSKGMYTSWRSRQHLCRDRVLIPPLAAKMFRIRDAQSILVAVNVLDFKDILPGDGLRFKGYVIADLYTSPAQHETMSHP